MGGAVTDMTKTNFKKRAGALAVASCLSFAPWLAEAAGLGKITVLSGLGQPLRAEIEINASRAELAGMSARLAPQAAFREAGIDYASALYDLRFAIEKRGNGTPVLKITSGKPVNDPFMDILVELNWPAGPIVREYTFLLDPPEVAARTAGRPVSTAEARVVETVRGGGAAPAAAPTNARSDAPKTVAATPRAVAEPRKSAEAGTHVVQPGETLRKIAGETKYDGVSLEQMLIGLFQKNPDAFIGDNINRLKAGAILNVPDKAAVAAVPPAEAKKVYVTQAADWNAYRQKLAAAAGKGQAKQDEAAQSASGKIAARVEDKAAPTEQGKDQVKVSRADLPAKGGAAGGKAAAAVEEELIAKDRALKEAQDRLAILEKNVVELQKLVDMKTQRLAELQQQAAGRKDEVKPATPAEAPKPAAPAEAPKAAETAPVVEAPKAVEPPKPVEPPKAAEEPKPAEAPKAPEVKQPEVAKKPAPVPEPESGFDAMPLLAGGGLLALLAGYFIARRRRSEPEPALTAAAPGPSSLGPNSVFRMTGGQSVDTGNVPLQTGEFSQTGPGTIDTDEVDPVAEADVYMAYGRDAQAEEILIEALRKDPHRTAIHAKLLEIYSNRKSVKQFDTLASELYAQTGGVGPEWEKVAAMGAALDPENPLYSGARPAVAAEAAAPRTPPVDTGRATMVLPGTLGVMAAAAVEEPIVIPQLPTEEVAQAPVAAAEEVDYSETMVSGDVRALDFDLGIPEQQSAAQPEQTLVQSPEMVAALPEIEAIDFDLGAPPAEPFAATEVNPQLAAAETQVMGTVEGVSDFSQSLVGFDATMVQSENLAEPQAGQIDFELYAGAQAAETVVNPLAMQGAMGSEYGGDTIVNPQFQGNLTGDQLAETMVNPSLVSEPSSGEATVTGGLAGVSPDFDAGADDFDVKLSESVFIGQPMPVPEFDMTSINLDLGTDTQEPTQVVSLFGGEGQGGQVNEEVATKLALAKAYEEMGDNIQARELLEEVIAEGSGDLVEQAREIIGRLRG